MDARTVVTRLLDRAGVTVGGSAPGDIQVHDPRWYGAVLGGRALALGETYVDGWWDAEPLDVFFHKIIGANLKAHIRADWKLGLALALNVLTNRNTRSRAFQVGEQHYDIGNDLYQLMLDQRLIYTCAYWPGQKTLDDAQEAKLELVCRKLGISHGMRVLDIGCGWGGFARFAAERHGAEVVGVTVSKEQVELARERSRGLKVEIRLEDYRNVTGAFDRVVSLGMFEHVGIKNYRTYMDVVRRSLRDDGLFLLQTIGSNSTSSTPDPWLTKHVFPNSILPSIQQIGAAIEQRFVMEDWHSFGGDYDKTLSAWHRNFVENWETIKRNPRYDARFYRLWRYYLCSLTGSFRARNIQLWQVVLSPRGVAGGYVSIR